jgi:diaminohydroxyphosphoribosylaminopyrimidine deaminase / 5-amino-6-(5-phosphoribosylamino)uracil reductase
MTDHRYMARAIQLAQKGCYTTDPNPRVGCVIVKNGQTVGEGWHQKAGEPHAEIHALNQAGDQAKGAVAYVTLEPCSHHGRTPPCAEALIKAGVTKVMAAMQDPNPLVAGKGLKLMEEAGIEVESGLLEEQAKELNPGFIKRMSRGLPYVRVKLAMSLDGRTAMASGESKWITGAEARQDVQKLRARSSVILTGSGTVLADDPSMNLRISAEDLGAGCEVQQPLRVVVDNNLSCPQNAKIFGLPGQTLVLTASATHHWQKDRVEIVQLAPHNQRINLKEAMEYLASRDINEVHVEAGSKLCGALLSAGVVDEMIIYMAPHIMGDGAKGLLHLPELNEMKQRIDLEIRDIRPIGKDWRITVIPEKKS